MPSFPIFKPTPSVPTPSPSKPKYGEPSPSIFDPTPYIPDPTPPIPPLFFGSKPTPKKAQGWIPQAKSGGKFRSLSRKPMSRIAALGRMSYAMDNTVSSQGRVIKSGGKISSKQNAYFGKVKQKLRPYKIRKGVALKMHNQIIEKRASRIDTSGEKRGLRVAQLTKNMGWLAQPKKRTVRKTKKKPVKRRKK